MKILELLVNFDLMEEIVLLLDFELGGRRRYRKAEGTGRQGEI